MISVPCIFNDNSDEVHVSKVSIDKKKFNRVLKEQNVDYSSDFEQDDNCSIVDFSNEIPSITDLNGIDIVFCLETTSAVKSNIQGIKNLVRQVMRDAENFVGSLENTKSLLKFGLVLYRESGDASTSYSTKIFDLTTRLKIKDAVINSVSCSGGEDKNGDVISGMKAAIDEISWREDSLKFLFHVIDTAPKISKLKKLKSFVNDFESELEDVFISMREKEIDYNVISLTKESDKLISLFSFYYDMDVYRPEIARFSSDKLNI